MLMLNVSLCVCSDFIFSETSSSPRTLGLLNMSTTPFFYTTLTPPTALLVLPPPSQSQFTVHQHQQLPLLPCSSVPSHPPEFSTWSSHVHSPHAPPRKHHPSSVSTSTDTPMMIFTSLINPSSLQLRPP